MVRKKIIDPEQIKKDFERSKTDSIQSVAKSLVETVVPFSGGIIRLYEDATDSSTKRCKKSILSIAYGLQELENRIDNFYIEDRFNDEKFEAILIRAMQIVMHTPQEEKLKALRNVVLNSALPSDLEDDMQIMFLDYIDSFTTLHIKLLKFFNDKKSNDWIIELAENVDHQDSMHDSNGGLVTEDYNVESYKVMRFELWPVLGYEFPDAIGEKNFFYQQVLSDLKSKDMIPFGDGSSGPVELTYSFNDKFNPQLQSFGKLFMEFITSPLSDD